MLPKRIRVIKRDQINVKGTFQLSLPETVTAGKVPLPINNPAASDGQLAQARILESHEGYAVLEVVCGCGCKNHIQCHYANA
jgi:hypothetical protein